MDIVLIVWPPAHHCFDSIEKDISEHYQLLEVSNHIMDISRFDAFVRAVYAVDSASDYKITYKLENLIRDPLEIRCLTVRFRKPDMEVQDVLNRLRCKDVHRLKDRIRSDYKDKVDDYVFDIVIHSTETHSQGVMVKSLIRDYERKSGMSTAA